MLTRLRVKGFKNLVDVDLSFGPFTVIAGQNGVGKSNLFDAIQLLSALADVPLLQALTGVRQETSSSSVARVFSQGPAGLLGDMSFEAEMLVGPEVVDDLGQMSNPSARHLRYSVSLKHSLPQGALVPKIEMTYEALDYLNREESKAALPFARKRKTWLHSVQGGRRTSPFISTRQGDDGAYIKVHEDSGHQGRPRELKASTLSRTLLSTINTTENPTALAVRREMQSWKSLQLEPARLRAPSEWSDRAELGVDGTGLPATLHRLFQSEADPSDIEARLVGRLFNLIGDVRTLRIDPDEKRETLTLLVGFKDGVEYRARDLSDGTLRFLALATLEADPAWNGLLCMEEPENGIHPSRISAMLELLQAITVDSSHPVDETNPLRQVMVNTHSPEVVGLVPDDALLLATSGWSASTGYVMPSVEFRPLEGTWRDHPEARYATRTQVMDYLKALANAIHERKEYLSATAQPVVSRPEIRSLFPEWL